ncbi:MAG TPA: tetratricopeptide repeat protein, partial [Gammaproteobacteria bacterium]|nr:tetratricopeptide repeat protein [Gammaproteobacteria bacterium]
EGLYIINNKAGDLLTFAAATLDAQVAAARGDSAAAIAAWRHAVTLEDRLAYDEPPAWFYTVRQSLGAALLRAGDHAAAEQEFREALATHPRDGRLLYGLWQTLLAQGRGSEALLVEQQFARAWADATAPLTLDDL